MSIANTLQKPKYTVAGNQPGRGYPVFQPGRSVPTNDNEPALDPMGNIGYPGKPGAYGGKRIQRITIDCTNVFTNMRFTIAGSLVWFSGQSGGTAAPMYVTLCNGSGNHTNDPIQFTYDRAVSGIPFNEILISNPTAQAGVTVEFTIILDNPKDRVGLNA